MYQPPPAVVSVRGFARSVSRAVRHPGDTAAAGCPRPPAGGEVFSPPSLAFSKSQSMKVGGLGRIMPSTSRLRRIDSRAHEDLNVIVSSSNDCGNIVPPGPR